MAHAHGGGAAMPVAGLQPCERSKITLISTTPPQEGGFGKMQNLGFIGGLARLRCGIAPRPVFAILIDTIT
jgi:hypothetical protein